jgi:hypothetical protein
MGLYFTGIVAGLSLAEVGGLQTPPGLSTVLFPTILFAPALICRAVARRARRRASDF